MNSVSRRPQCLQRGCGAPSHRRWHSMWHTAALQLLHRPTHSSCTNCPWHSGHDDMMHAVATASVHHGLNFLLFRCVVEQRGAMRGVARQAPSLRDVTLAAPSLDLDESGVADRRIACLRRNRAWPFLRAKNAGHLATSVRAAAVARREGFSTAERPSDEP